MSLPMLSRKGGIWKNPIVSISIDRPWPRKYNLKAIIQTRISGKMSRWVLNNPYQIWRII
jgi:hypothetical protein